MFRPATIPLPPAAPKVGSPAPVKPGGGVVYFNSSRPDGYRIDLGACGAGS